MKTKREVWLDSLDYSTTELWVLEENKEKEVKMYETKDKITGDWQSHPDPIFHVWKGGDQWLYCGPNYRYAYNKYVQAIRD